MYVNYPNKHVVKTHKQKFLYYIFMMQITYSYIDSTWAQRNIILYWPYPDDILNSNCNSRKISPYTSSKCNEHKFVVNEKHVHICKLQRSIMMRIETNCCFAGWKDIMFLFQTYFITLLLSYMLSFKCLRITTT